MRPAAIWLMDIERRITPQSILDEKVRNAIIGTNCEETTSK